jgi:hypothetical protein
MAMIGLGGSELEPRRSRLESAAREGKDVPPSARKFAPNAVFLNIPYDEGFRTLYLAYIVGVIHLGFEPRVTLGLPDGIRRLDKILAEIQGCRYSIHDLSRVELDLNPPFRTPRFNMPFELGLAVTWASINPKKHQWFVFETRAFRAQKSLSDLNGSDPRIHNGRVQGVMRELSNAFVRPGDQPTVPRMMSGYRAICRQLARIMADAGAESLFEARAFRDLCYAAKIAAEKERLRG